MYFFAFYKIYVYSSSASQKFMEVILGYLGILEFPQNGSYSGDDPFTSQ